jgi:hypothetical protein
MIEKPTVTGMGRAYFAAAVTPTTVVALPGEICGHTHRSQATAANCALRMHKRLTRHEPLGWAALRAFTVKVGTDGACETPVLVEVAQ